MLIVGEKGSETDHSSNPIILQDIFVRIGGVHPGVASTHQAVVINSNNVIGDHFWLWRADHGDGVGWNLNTAENGLVVNGDYVTMHGLFVEHFQEYDIIWRGEYGKTFFLQNEKCYDPQNQNDWKSHEGKALGYASYKVCNSVKNHYAVGLGSYDVFVSTNGASIFLDNTFEVPDTEGVKIENACIVEFSSKTGPLVGFNHIINDTGFGISTGIGGKGFGRQVVISYCNTKSLCLDDYYEHGGNDSGIINEEKGKQTSDDPKAEIDIQKVDKNRQFLKNNNTRKLNNLNLLHKVKCNGCGKYPIYGYRFKCALCKSLDYCEDCEKKFSQKHNHPFLKIYEPCMAPVFFKCQTKK
jgi:hypothetical protein